jgi:hypothetical protein
MDIILYMFLGAYLAIWWFVGFCGFTMQYGKKSTKAIILTILTPVLWPIYLMLLC